MIHPFEWHFDTRICFGPEAEDQVGACCAEYGRKVLIVCGGSSRLKESGLWDRVTASLEAAGVSYVRLEGIQANPIIGTVREGIELFRTAGADSILAIGGGSVIDTAKAIAAGVHYSGDPWDLFLGRGEVIDPPPVGVILTIAAAGSEGSTGAVITNPETREKYDVLHPALRPAYALLDPTLTLTLPAYQTACGVADILAHAMERYFTDSEDVELTDRLGEGLMQTVVNNGLILTEEPENTSARSQIMWASTLAHNGLLEGGRHSCWASHAIATELSAAYDTTHGATLSVIIPAWMKYTYTTNVPRFARFANRVLGVEYDIADPERTARRGIDALTDFYRKLGLPTTLAEIGAEDESKFEAMAVSATRFGPIGCIRKLSKQDVIEIYKLAR